jgi:hypothetical protein
VEGFFGLAVQPDQHFLIAFFHQPQPRVLAFHSVVTKTQSHDRTDPRKSVGHDTNCCAIPQAFDIHNLLVLPTVFPRDLDLPHYRDGVEELPHLVCFHGRRDVDLAAELRTLDEQRRLFRNNLLDDERVEQPAQRRKVLLDRWRLISVDSI